ncbi:MAG: family 20 glycosylhydrolase, partial [Saprospiraceae bacterium]
EGGLAAARQNHDVIMTPGTHCYFDHYQSESPTEPLAISGYTPVEKVYHWNPIPKELDANYHKYILGGQANLWTEYISSYSKVEYMVYARGIAMAEALWSRDKNYPLFVSRLESHTNWWKNKGANIANHIYELKPDIKGGNGTPTTISFTLPVESDILWSLHGEAGGVFKSTSSFTFNQSGKYAFKRKGNDADKPETTIIFSKHKGTSSNLTLEPAPSPRYPGLGVNSLSNGIFGPESKFVSQEWLGYNGTNASGTYDFRKIVTIHDINIKFFHSPGSWVHAPKRVDILVSGDGQTWSTRKTVSVVSKGEEKIVLTTISLNGLTTRYLRFVVTNGGPIPKGYAGEGSKAWLFIDEVEIN